MEKDKIDTFINSEEVKQTALKAIERLLNMYKGTVPEHILPLFVVISLFTETDVSKFLEEFDIINTYDIMMASVKDPKDLVKQLNDPLQ